MCAQRCLKLTLKPKYANSGVLRALTDVCVCLCVCLCVYNIGLNYYSDLLLAIPFKALRQLRKLVLKGHEHLHPGRLNQVQSCRSSRTSRYTLAQGSARNMLVPSFLRVRHLHTRTLTPKDARTHAHRGTHLHTLTHLHSRKDISNLMSLDLEAAYVHTNVFLLTYWF